MSLTSDIDVGLLLTGDPERLSRCFKGVISHFIWCVSFQIAAKIGGDGVPSASNNGGAESYPFAAQKRSLEEAG